MKDDSKSEAELAEVADTLKRTISTIQKEMTMNLAVLQRKIDARNTNNVVAALAAMMDLQGVSRDAHRSWRRRAGNQAPMMTVSCQLLWRGA